MALWRLLSRVYLLFGMSIPRVATGIGGYAWVAVLHYWLGLSYTATLLLANMMPIIWLAVFHLVLQRVEPSTSSKVILDYERLPLAAEEAAGEYHQQ